MADPATILATWFTPSSLFIFVNLVIGTIALASRFNNNNNNNAPNNLNQNQQQPQLLRSTSLLNRVMSFNLRHYNNNNQNEPTNITQPESESETESTQPQLIRKPSLLQRVISFKLYKHEPQNSQIHFTQPEPENRSHETDPGQDPSDEVKSKVEMKKSASEKELPVKMEWDDEEEDEETVERRRPATAAARSETTVDKEDEEVDAKADDFIIRFKKQLKLQRLDSFLRYRDTNRGI